MSVMDRAFLIGDRVYLRPMDIGDAEGPYLQWVNSPTAYLALGSLYFPTTKAALEAYIKRQTEHPDTAFFAIMTKSDDRFIGTAKIGPVETVHRHAYIGLLIGAETEWGKGYGTETAMLLLKYGFRQLNLHKISAGANGSNGASIKMFEKAGMKVECRRPKQLFVNGVWEDHVILAMFDSEFANHCSRP
jgi:ribosomal-protein-alanine N-acetyltransferase